jgi:hypothetical protein
MHRLILRLKPCILPTRRIDVLCDSQNKQRLFPQTEWVAGSFVYHTAPYQTPEHRVFIIPLILFLFLWLP